MAILSGTIRTIDENPGLINLYEEKKLVKYLQELNDREDDEEGQIALSAEEKLLLKIFKIVNLVRLLHFLKFGYTRSLHN